MDQNHNKSTIEVIDDSVLAEIPDVNTNPELYDRIKRCMIHRPCGPLNPNSVCMVIGKCTKTYPKHFNPCTSIDNYSCLTYRRRNDEKTIKIGDINLDNR